MGVHLSATIAINISNHLSHMMSAKVLWRKRFSWVTMSKCKQTRHMRLHPNIRSWMSCSQEYTSRSIARALPTTEEEINNLDSDIIRYMDFYRSDIAKQKIIPKQHILECHMLRLWKFGLLGFMGEQGGEETHGFINELKVRVRGIVDPEQKIRVLMKEQLTIVFPPVKAAMPTHKDRRNNTELASCPELYIRVTVKLFPRLFHVSLLRQH